MTDRENEQQPLENPAPDRPNVAAKDKQAAPVELSPEEQLAACRDESREHYDQLLRARAELDNYRKRAQKEQLEIRQYQSLALIRDLLPALDNLGRAVDAAAGSEGAANLVQGVEMVRRQLHDALAKYSVTPIEAVDQPFDPNLHEAVQQIPSAERPAMTVLEDVERGYRLHDRVVRPSKVIVSSGPPENTGE